MKLIIAIIRPHTLEAVKDALGAVGVQGLTISEVQGFGRQKGQSEIYRGAEYQISFLPKVRIDVAVDDSLKDQAVEAIQSTASSGKIGDGKIFVLNLEEALRIRTGEAGEAAL
ncbi:MAG: P-II family nitrogen regulator [Sphingomonadales bacterium]|nr:P-II family nitrogen regulator [Sphingomonadales bacterium]